MLVGNLQYFVQLLALDSEWRTPCNSEAFGIEFTTLPLLFAITLARRYTKVAFKPTVCGV